ncbi:MAG TPA: 50S ribosomal protein L32 [Acidobacteriota bacterium]|nr:50S ribosomal protein L32 [Acidobacteriota bacterium]
MANPKRRHSKSRRGKRRAHDALSVANLSSCSHCGSAVMPHRVCPNCGYYKGRQVIEVEEL